MDEHGTGVTSAESPRALAPVEAETNVTTATVTQGQSPASGASQATTQSVSTPKEAMHLDEIRRMRAFLWFVFFIATTVCFLVPAMHGDPLATWLHVSATAVTALTAVVLQIAIRDGDRYRPWMSTVLGLIAATAVNAGFYFWGVYSAVVLVIPIGTYFFALGQSLRGALAIHAYATVSHAVLTLLQIYGVIPIASLITPLEMDRLQQIGMLAAIQVVFMAAFVMARGLRKASLDTLEQLDRAVRDNAQREALLNEAKQDLAWALRIGGPGRHSEQTLGSYKLGNVIGRGAMGEVYEAVHTQTGQPAAVKLLGQDAMLKPDLVSRFLREVGIAASLDVDNVVRVLEVPDALDPLPYLVMERLNGETLADQLRREPKLPLAEVTALLQALARGIGAAHDAGIVHRDLKPRNVFRDVSSGKPVWKILDFGVSKLMDHGGTLTQGHVVGTPAYMAPEQARSLEVDARADLYSLGVIGYRVLTGRPAFSGTDIPSLLRAVVYDTPPRPTDIASLPPEFDFVLAIAMAKDPADRFATADELWRAFEAAELGVLSAPLQRRGDEMMQKYPWGTRDVA